MDKNKEKIAEAAAVLGQIKTPAKAAASRINGGYGGRPAKPLEEIPCNCGATEDSAHKWRCLRGQAYRRRVARAPVGSTTLAKNKRKEQTTA